VGPGLASVPIVVVGDVGELWILPGSDHPNCRVRGDWDQKAVGTSERHDGCLPLDSRTGRSAPMRCRRQIVGVKVPSGSCRWACS